MPALGYHQVRDVLKALRNAAIQAMWRDKQLLAVLLVNADTALGWLTDLHDLATSKDAGASFKPVVISEGIRFENALDAYLSCEASILGHFAGSPDNIKAAWTTDLFGWINAHESRTAGLESLIVSAVSWMSSPQGQAALPGIDLPAWEPHVRSFSGADTHGAGRPGIRIVAPLFGDVPMAEAAFIPAVSLKAEAESLRAAMRANDATLTFNEIRSLNDDPSAAGMMSESERDMWCGLVGFGLGAAAGGLVGGPAGVVAGGALAIVATERWCAANVYTSEEQAAREERAQDLDRTADLAEGWAAALRQQADAADEAAAKAQEQATQAADAAANPPEDATEQQKADLQAKADAAAEAAQEAAEKAAAAATAAT